MKCNGIYIEGYESSWRICWKKREFSRRGNGIRVDNGENMIKVYYILYVIINSIVCNYKKLK